MTRTSNGPVLDYGDEAIIPLGDKQIRCPAHPAECDYVRITDLNGGELVYWLSTEWAEAPQEVMGAILGAIAVPVDQLVRLLQVKP